MAGKNPYFARTNAIKARKLRQRNMADPANLEAAMDEFATRLIATTAAIVKREMEGRHPSEECSIIRPRVRTTIVLALLERLHGLFPEIGIQGSVTQERVLLNAVRAERTASKPWRGVLTAKHVEHYGERSCPECGLRLAIGDSLVVPGGAEMAWHKGCAPKEMRVDVVRVFPVAARHLERRPGVACAHCEVAFSLEDRAAWKFGWTAMLHEACWAELGKPETLA
jgi:hypothetical protein